VHGLNGHREKSWTDEKSRIMWLRDLLPQRVPDARILTFGYDADTLKLSNVSHLTLNDHATSLIMELLRVRRSTETEQRPIIFLAHSLGGIVVKHALVTCDLARQGHNEEQRSIKVSTYGIMFFGTPHAGANGVEFQTLLNNIGQIFVPGNSRILRLLNRDSDHLCYLTTLYSAINSDFKTICFFEEYNTPLFMGASVMIVPKASAVISEVADTVAIALHKHHIDLVKFASAQDQSFEIVVDQIGVMMKSVIKKIDENWKHESRMKNVREIFNIVTPIQVDITQDVKPSPQSSWNIPYPRNPFFTGCDEILLLISARLQQKEEAALSKPQALAGLGGIGKTQIAIEYAYRHRQDYNVIFWEREKYAHSSYINTFKISLFLCR